MNMIQGIYGFTFLLLFTFLGNCLFANGTWVGGTTGFWDDDTNWGGGVQPTITDDVIIPAGVTVTIRVAGEFAQSVRINAGGTLNISAGDLTISESNRHGIFFPNGGTIDIAQGALLNISNTFADGIRVANNTVIFNNAGSIAIANNIEGSGIRVLRMGILNLTNSGTINLGPDIEEDGFFVDLAGSLNLINRQNGIINGLPGINSQFFSIRSANTASIISNFGRINIDMAGTEDDAIFINSPNSRLINQRSGTIIASNVEDDVFNFDDGASLENFGSITTSNTEDQAFDISIPGFAINHATGVININGVRDEEAIDVTGRFTNDGVINITGVQGLDGGKSAIDLDDSGFFTNNNLINIALEVSASAAIEVSSDGRLINSDCAIINITTQHRIENDGIFDNIGIITTVFTGSNFNSGMFNNSGIISAPQSTFTLTPNGLVGNTPNDGPIPTNLSKCVFVPTMSEWGIVIFGLLILNLSVFSIRRKQSLLGT